MGSKTKVDPLLSSALIGLTMVIAIICSVAAMLTA